MSKKIFENAKFGDAFKTRDGRKAIYHRHLSHRVHYLICEEYCERIPYNSDGTCIGNCDLDIISRWDEPISEEELREMSYEADYTLNSYTDKCESFHEGFHAGYRKAEERLL